MLVNGIPRTADASYETVMACMNVGLGFIAAAAVLFLLAERNDSSARGPEDDDRRPGLGAGSRRGVLDVLTGDFLVEAFPVGVGDVDDGLGPFLPRLPGPTWRKVTPSPSLRQTGATTLPLSVTTLRQALPQAL
ncbi:hypothetical protein [Streptomyces sp. NBC_01353]|uniref:hypothetical protein n=1 Tax=Streptomyces sp. NBC_01353 TaxID=2903835 RepID=UPI002E332838|nr:hypothetical protein [Streptomyces sp. NBC_01353]